MELEEFHVAVFYYSDKILSTSVDYTNQISCVCSTTVTSIKQKQQQQKKLPSRAKYCSVWRRSRKAVHVVSMVVSHSSVLQQYILSKHVPQRFSELLGLLMIDGCPCCSYPTLPKSVLLYILLQMNHHASIFLTSFFVFKTNTQGLTFSVTLLKLHY